MKSPIQELAQKLTSADRKELLKTGKLEHGKYRMVASGDSYRVIRRLQR